MSKLKTILEITPSEFMNKAKDGEVFISKDHDCLHCFGRGYFTPKQVGPDEFKENLCPVCLGSGKLDAKIVIGWSPSEITPKTSF